MLVVDTNQAALLPRPRRHVQRRLVLPELILAEILLRGEAARDRTFQVIGRYSLRIGVHPSQVLDDIAGLSEAEIQRYRPFLATSTDYVRDVVRAVRRRQPTAGMLRWAPRTKQRQLNFMAWLNGAATQVRDRIRNQGIERVATFADVASSANTLDSFIGSLVVDVTRNKGARTLRVSDDAAFLAAVMANPYLSHYFLAILHYVTSVSRLWQTQEWNVDPIQRRDDWTDVTLPLYLNDDHDVLVSADNLVRRMVRDVAPQVRIRRAAEL